MRTILCAIVVSLLLTGCQPPVEKGSSGTSGTSGTAQAGHVESLRRRFKLKDLQRVTLKVGGKEIKAWVMDTPDKREEGMMWLVEADVAPDDGMIFAFPFAKEEGFWMRNTHLPLDLVFITAGKKVANIVQGKPFDEQTSLRSKGPVQYVLELREGAAERLGIKPGMTFEIPDSVKGK